MPIPEASGLGNCLLLMFGNWWKLQVAGARYKIQTYLVKRYKEQSYVCYNPGWMVCCAETQWVSTTVQTVGIAWYGITWYGMVSTAQRGAAPSRKMPPEYSCDNSSCECSCHLPKKEDKSQRLKKLRFSSIFFFFPEPLKLSGWTGRVGSPSKKERQLLWLRSNSSSNRYKCTFAIGVLERIVLWINAIWGQRQVKKMGMWVIWTGEKEGDRGALERELPGLACYQSTILKCFKWYCMV